MAKRCSMGVTSFIQYSRQLTNMTPCQYLNRSRLLLAAELLQERSEAERGSHRDGQWFHLQPILRHVVPAPFWALPARFAARSKPPAADSPPRFPEPS